GAGEPEPDAARAGPPPHPLDPLTPEEITEAVRVVRKEKAVGPACRFVSVALAEPPKPALQADRPGRAIPREAAVPGMGPGPGRAHEACVDLGAGAVRSWEPVPDGLQPPITVDEFAECEATVKRSPEFRAALRKRGVTDPDLVMVDAWSAGTYGDEPPEEKG